MSVAVVMVAEGGGGEGNGDLQMLTNSVRIKQVPGYLIFETFDTCILKGT